MSETDTPAPAPEAPRFLPINDWAKYFDWPPPGGLRHLRFHAETNGFAPAFKKVRPNDDKARTRRAQGFEFDGLAPEL